MKKRFQCSFMRYEKKYLLTKKQYKLILEGMKDYMVDDIYGQTTNCNIYYDTDNWELIRKSIEKPVYKEKLRVRSYGVPRAGEQVFIEIKKKYDGVVYKRRITMEANNAALYLAGDMLYSPDNQIGKEIEYFQRIYQTKPKVYIAYDRTSFAGKDNPDLRITFDQNIRFREHMLNLKYGDFGETMLLDDTILMEIKIPGTTPLWLVRLLSEIGARQTSFSKYGTYYKNYVVAKTRKEMSYSA